MPNSERSIELLPYPRCRVVDILLQRYKPGSLSAVPSVVVPHQPRLDWQMWFAALSNYQRDGWIINLADKIMDVRVRVRVPAGADCC